MNSARIAVAALAVAPLPDGIFLALALLVTGALLVFAITAALNAAVFPRLGRRGKGVNGPSWAGQRPRVWVLIPARNEATNIGNTVRSLLAQTYPEVSVVVLDDQSDDGTAEATREAAAGNPHLRVLSGQPLPAGWLGKNWACHQLSQHTGEGNGSALDVLIFTDADVQWAPDAVAALVAEIEATGADLLTVWPTQRTVTWSERLVVPLMAFTIVGYLPVTLVHRTPWPVFAAANGQCLAFRRSAYDAVSGHASVRHNIVEDMGLARRIKARGLRLRMADGAGLVSCRMYDGWQAVRNGYAKNILAGYGGHVSALILATLFHWLVFLGPWLWLLLGWLASNQSPFKIGYPVWPLALIALGLTVRGLTAAVTRQRVRDALLLPVSVGLMSIIAGQAIWWQWRRGGPQWKGRAYGDKPRRTADGPRPDTAPEVVEPLGQEAKVGHDA